MKIGYPCVNLSVGCTSGSTFRLKSYSDERMESAVANNLECLGHILEFNVENGLLHFRLSSDLVPLASHPICTYDWQSRFREEFEALGKYARKNGIRLSMHPGQYTLINSPNERIFNNSIEELLYHVDVLELMKTPEEAKTQIHVGGVYGEKTAAIERFVRRYDELAKSIKTRLVIENDERSYSIRDCIAISERVGIPVVFDSLHHDVNNNGESYAEALRMVTETWKPRNGLPMVDYSSQAIDGRPGKHSKSIDLSHFREFLSSTAEYDFDLMLEIKDKETSAILALESAKSDARRTW